MIQRRTAAQMLPLVLLLLVALASANIVQVGVKRKPATHPLASLIHDADEEKSAENKALLAAATAVEAPLYTGEGSHTVQVLVGGQVRELIIDTGSGKTAFVCDGCDGCGTHHHHPPFVMTPATRFLACDEASECLSCDASGDGEGKCRYGQTYVEGDYWNAYKVSDVMTFAPGTIANANANGSDSSLAAAVAFGCIFEQSGVFNAQTADGIMGFSKHPDSIFEQLYASGATRSRIFSQCLAEDGGSLTLGGVDLSLNDSQVHYTPLRETGYQYWTVSLASVSVGDADNTLQVNADVFNRDRGCVLDSGTTFVYMPTAAREPFVAAWRKATGSDNYLPESTQYYPDLSLTQAAASGRFPPICFQFVNSAQLCIPASRYFTPLSDSVVAGTIFFSDAVRSTILGASVLSGHVVIYDVDGNRIGVAPAHCDRPLSTLGDQELALVELSVNPGGERFRKEGDYCGKATEWLLVAVTMFAITGLVNTVWVANVRALAQVPPRPIVESPSITVTTASDDNDVVVGLFLTGTSGVTEEDDGDDVGHDEDDEQFAFHLME
jgi:hypothetical protein